MLSEGRKSSISPNAAPDFRLEHSRQQNRKESPKQSTELGRGCIPGSPGESRLVSRGSQGLRSPLESRRGSLGAP